MGVSASIPSASELSTDRLGRHDSDDAQMLAAARLAFDLAIPNELAGTNTLLAPDRDVVWLRRLFERAVGGFYSVALDDAWTVHPGREMHWPLEDASLGLKAILPKMRSDITIDNEGVQRRFIVDTKFTRMLVPGQHGKESLRSGYVYQIYAYARACEGTGDTLAETATGILLHPSVGVDIYEFGRFHGHEFRFITVDLAASAKAIRERLLRTITL